MSLWAFLCIYMRPVPELGIPCPTIGTTQKGPGKPAKADPSGSLGTDKQKRRPARAAQALRHTLNSARTIQRSAGGHLTMTICMAHLRFIHFGWFGRAILCIGFARRYPSLRESTTRPYPRAQDKVAEGAVNSLLTPRG